MSSCDGVMPIEASTGATYVRFAIMLGEIGDAVARRRDVERDAHAEGLAAEAVPGAVEGADPAGLHRPSHRRGDGRPLAERCRRDGPVVVSHGDGHRLAELGVGGRTDRLDRLRLGHPADVDALDRDARHDRGRRASVRSASPRMRRPPTAARRRGGPPAGRAARRNVGVDVCVVRWPCSRTAPDLGRKVDR